MIEFRPCEPWHIREIEAQASQADEKAYNLESVDDLVGHSIALSAFHNGKIIGAGGLRGIWPGRAAAWMLLARDAGPALPAIARKLRFVLSTYPANRIELTVRASFGPGCRLAALLGFIEEARLVGFFPDGSAARLFALLRQPGA
jgi:hypothetical protein